jgi:hypothetical protein
VSWTKWCHSQWKPSWTPAPATIGLSWQILYPIIIATFSIIFVQACRRTVPWLRANVDIYGYDVTPIGFGGGSQAGTWFCCWA